MSTKVVLSVLSGLALAACAPSVPKELSNARSAYNSMNQGAAPAVAPEAVRQARNSLDRAEQSFQDTGASPTTRELATKAEEDAERAQVACATREAATATVTIQQKKGIEGQLSPEQQRVQEILRTVPGTVMFKFDSDELRPPAKERLDKLASALVEAKKANQEPSLIIEGHADSTGSDEYNKDLSERRAEAVKNYLDQQGYDPNLIRTVAFGSSHPFASNETAEGRADNRRVEIRLGEKKGGE